MATEQLFADRYRLERRLGVGGMATVQLAFDTRLERLVAVKLLAEHLAEDSAFVSRFRREALSAAKLVQLEVGKYLAVWEEQALAGRGWAYRRTMAATVTVKGGKNEKVIEAGKPAASSIT